MDVADKLKKGNRAFWGRRADWLWPHLWRAMEWLRVDEMSVLLILL